MVVQKQKQNLDFLLLVLLTCSLPFITLVEKPIEIIGVYSPLKLSVSSKYAWFVMAQLW